MTRKREAEILQRFTDQYGTRVRGELYRAIECEVIGCELGANGYTTVAQAAALARALRLKPGSLLLDIGCGQGWPGLRIAQLTGCGAVLGDRPLAGLLAGVNRASKLKLAGRVAWALATAPELPFALSSFDAIVHTDVLCCLPRKAETLSACRRLLRAGGRMAFHTILIAPGVEERSHRRASRYGPPAVATRSTYGAMLATAGFRHIRESDVTAAFRRTQAAWLRARERRYSALAEIEGEKKLEENLMGNRRWLKLIDEGLLRRSMFVCEI